MKCCRFVFVLILLTIVSCRSGRSPAGGANRFDVTGRVVDPAGVALSGARVSAGGGGAAAITDANGTFRLRGTAATPRLVLNVTAAGFVNTTRIVPASARGVINVVVIWPRAAAVAIDPARGGSIPFAGQGSLAIPPNALVDAEGRAISGPVDVSVTWFDVSDRARLDAVPGDFSARMRDGSQRRLQSFGVFEIAATDRNGRRADLARGTSATVRMPIPRELIERAPRQLGSYSFDNVSGQWVEEGTLVNDGLVYTGMITRFDWSWNADDPIDTTCMRFLVLTPGFNPQPAPNIYVKATGVSYQSVSYGYTNANGLVCLLVKRNDQIEVQAFDPSNGTVQSQQVVITSPNIASGPADCGDTDKCPQTTIQLDIITGGGRTTP